MNELVPIRGGALPALISAAGERVSLRPAFSQHARRHPQHFQPSTSSRLALDAADLPRRGGEPMAGCGRGRVIAHKASGLVFANHRLS